MATEIEKKYRLTPQQFAMLRVRLHEVGAKSAGASEFEVNTLYAGNGLYEHACVLRLRRVGATRAWLTYKERDPTPSAIKRQREEETEIADPYALAAILEALGYAPALVYEKRRATWSVVGAEVVLDELAFGLFAEIEGTIEAINAAESLLDLADAEAEPLTYPELTARYGTRRGAVCEARLSEGGRGL